MLFLFLFRSVYYKYTALYVLTGLVGFVNFTRPRRLGALTSVEGNTVLCYCTQDAKWRPGGGGWGGKDRGTSDCQLEGGGGKDRGTSDCQLEGEF